jgi:hypothetical protein
MSPEVSEKVRMFIRNYIEEHGGMSKEQYKASDERKALGLPDDGTIYRTFNSWREFIEWCGIEYRRKPHKKPWRAIDDSANLKRIDAMLAQGRIDYESAFDYSAIPAIDRGVKPVYNWRTMQYEDMHILELR